MQISPTLAAMCDTAQSSFCAAPDNASIVGTIIFIALAYALGSYVAWLYHGK